MESGYPTSITIEQALVLIDTMLTPAKLTNTQELVFRQCWEGKSYSEIAEKAGYDAEYIKSIGAKLSEWRTCGPRVSTRFPFETGGYHLFGAG